MLKKAVRPGQPAREVDLPDHVPVPTSGRNAKIRRSSTKTRVINIENEETDQAEDVAAQYTKDGVEAKSLIAREQVAAGRVRMISFSDKQMAAWIINSDSEVDL
ncbi:MAG: hypothetical protein ACLVC2_09000 [Emergencia timonensis]